MGIQWPALLQKAETLEPPQLSHLSCLALEHSGFSKFGDEMPCNCALRFARLLQQVDPDLKPWTSNRVDYGWCCRAHVLFLRAPARSSDSDPMLVFAMTRGFDQVFRPLKSSGSKGAAEFAIVRPAIKKASGRMLVSG